MRVVNVIVLNGPPAISCMADETPSTSDFLALSIMAGMLMKVSRHPILPHVQTGPWSSTVICPNSPAVPDAPV